MAEEAALGGRVPMAVVEDHHVVGLNQPPSEG